MATENLYTPHSIRTASGKYFDFTVMDPDTICIEDIAHALANIPRFTGHTPHFYSVAQHSIRAAMIAPEEIVLDALLHDATEAYMLDIAKPLKNLLPDYTALENKLQEVIAKKFGLIMPMPVKIKEIDAYLLEKEFSDIVDNPKCYSQLWLHAELVDQFLCLYDKYKRV